MPDKDEKHGQHAQGKQLKQEVDALERGIHEQETQKREAVSRDRPEQLVVPAVGTTATFTSTVTLSPDHLHLHQYLTGEVYDVGTALMPVAFAIAVVVPGSYATIANGAAPGAQATLHRNQFLTYALEAVKGGPKLVNDPSQPQLIARSWGIW